MSTRLAMLLETATTRGMCRVETPTDKLDAAKLHRSSADIAQQLIERGATRGEPVVVAINNHATDIASLFGAWRAGVVAVPVHASAPPAVFARIQRSVGTRFTIESGGIEGDGDPPPPRTSLQDAALHVGQHGQPQGCRDRARALCGQA